MECSLESFQNAEGIKLFLKIYATPFYWFSDGKSMQTWEFLSYVQSIKKSIYKRNMYTYVE